MEKEEKKKKRKVNYGKAAMCIAVGILAAALLSSKKENKKLHGDIQRLNGVKENQEDLIKGLNKTIEKLSYSLGKQSNY